MKRNVRMIFLLLLAFSLFVSCGEGTQTGDTNDTTDVTEVTDVSLENYVFVYSASFEEDVITEIKTGLNALSEKTGLKFRLEPDTDAQQVDTTQRKEILIGATVRTESKTALESIAGYDYRVEKTDVKVLLLAKTKDTLLSCWNAFLNALTAEDGVLHYKGNVSFVSEKKTFFSSENPLSGYSVIYPAENTTLRLYAQKIADALQKNYGATLTVSDDSSTEKDCEILLGETNRTGLSAYYSGRYAPDSFHTLIRAYEKKLIVFATSDYRMVMAVNQLLALCEETPYGSEFVLPENLHLNEYAFLYETEQELQGGSDFRVMTYNVLSQELTPTASDFAEERGQYVALTILQYQPDVIGMQEVDAGAYAYLEKWLGSSYAFTMKKTPAGQYSYTTLFYNTKTTKYMEGGVELCSTGNRRARMIVWGVFENIATGNRFIVANTHWDLTDQKRENNASEQVAYLKQLMTKYPDLPLVTTGDYNTPNTASYFKNYLTMTGQTETVTSAETLSYYTVGTIDHINSRGLAVRFYKLLNKDAASLGSDHKPIYADFSFIRED